MKQFLILTLLLLSSTSSFGNPLENCKRHLEGVVASAGANVSRINSAVQGFYQTYPYVTPVRDTTLSDKVDAIGKRLDELKERIEKDRSKIAVERESLRVSAAEHKRKAAESRERIEEIRRKIRESRRR